MKEERRNDLSASNLDKREGKGRKGQPPPGMGGGEGQVENHSDKSWVWLKYRGDGEIDSTCKSLEG